MTFFAKKHALHDVLKTSQLFNMAANTSTVKKLLQNFVDLNLIFNFFSGKVEKPLVLRSHRKLGDIYL